MTDHQPDPLEGSDPHALAQPVAEHGTNTAADKADTDEAGDPWD